MPKIDAFYVVSILGGINSSSGYTTTNRDINDLTAIRSAGIECNYGEGKISSVGCFLVKEEKDLKLKFGPGDSPEILQVGAIFINAEKATNSVSIQLENTVTGNKFYLKIDGAAENHIFLNGNRCSSIFAGRVWRSYNRLDAGSSITWEENDRYDDEQFKTTQCGWVQPLVISIDLKKRDCPVFGAQNANEVDNDVTVCLSRQWAEYRLLAVDPKFPPETDLQFQFYNAWWDRVKKKPPKTRTCLERLVFGQALDCEGVLPPWYVFMALDHLDGFWHIEKFGQGEPVLRWGHTSPTSNNQEWYINYWLKHRKDITRDNTSWEDISKNVIDSSPPEERPHESDEKCDTLKEFIACTPLLFHEAKDLLKDFVSRSSDLQTQIDAIQLEPFHNDRFNSSRIIKQLASVLLPSSPILVDLPEIKLDDKIKDGELTRWVQEQNESNSKLIFEMNRSRGGGEIGMLNDLADTACQIESQPPNEQQILLSVRNSWTGQWHRILQQLPADTRLRYDDESFRLDVSHFDKDSLDSYPLPQLKLNSREFTWNH